MAGGMALLPSCLRDAGKSSIELKNIDVTLDQENLLADIAETIIPETDTPGAKTLKLHLFLLKMLDDCHTEEEQKLFFKGLDALQDQADRDFSKSFAKMTPAERKQLLLSVEKNQKDGEALTTWYGIMKRRTIGGYLNSKYVMSNLIKWELVPGRYNGFFPVKTA